MFEIDVLIGLMAFPARKRATLALTKEMKTMIPRPSNRRLFGAPLWTVHVDVVIHGIGERIIFRDATFEEAPIIFRGSRIVAPEGRGDSYRRSRPSLPQLIRRFLRGGAWYIMSFERRRLSFPPLTWPPFAAAVTVAGVALNVGVLWVAVRILTWILFVIIGLALCLIGRGA